MLRGGVVPRGLSGACALACALLLMLLSTGVAHAATPTLKRVQIRSGDGVIIKGSIAAPARLQPGRQYPGISFAAAWNGGDQQNTVPALKLAQRGYIVFSYTTRGTGKDGDGKVSMGGPPDIMDMSATLDWLLANYPVDPQRLGAGGISYGAGIALLASAFDPRIRSVVSMSGWTDQMRAFWPNETRNAWATFILVQSARQASHLGPEFLDIFSRFFQNRQIEDNLAFGAARSAQTYIDRINANRPAILLSQQWNEMAFPPDQIVDFFNDLQGPKRMLLQPGDHVSQETLGLVGARNRILSETYDWYDRTLKHAPDAKAEAGSITLQRRTPWGDKALEHYRTWDEISSGTRRWHLRGGTGFRAMGDAPSTGWTTSFRPALSTDDGPGGPLVGNLAEAFTTRPINAKLSSFDRNSRAIWRSEPLTERVYVRGAPRVRFTVTPQSAKGTVILNLYSLSPSNTVYGITHTPLTWRNKPVGVPITYELPLRPTAFDLPPGHRLMLSVSGMDLNYILDKNPLGARIVLSSPAEAPSYVEVPVR